MAKNDDHSWLPGQGCLGAGEKEVPPWTQKHQIQKRLKQGMREILFISLCMTKR